jgi:hypothetical protein
LRRGIEKSDSFSLAAAGTTGASFGTSHNTSTLLLPSELGAGSWRLTDMTDVKRIDDGEVGGKACYGVKGQHTSDMSSITFVVYVDKESFLIRKIEEETSIPLPQSKAMKMSKTIIYKPAINEAIDEEALAFNPPQ